MTRKPLGMAIALLAAAWLFPAGTRGSENCTGTTGCRHDKVAVILCETDLTGGITVRNSSVTSATAVTVQQGDACAATISALLQAGLKMSYGPTMTTNLVGNQASFGFVFLGDDSDDDVVIEDGRSRGNDPYVVNSAALDGDRLSIEVSYGGGCRDHAFTLVISKSFRESDPVQLAAVLAHEANGDPCEAWLTETHVFDLSLIKTRYRQFYGPGPGRVVLQIEGVSGEHLLYEFDG